MELENKVYEGYYLGRWKFFFDKILGVKKDKLRCECVKREIKILEGF